VIGLNLGHGVADAAKSGAELRVAFRSGFVRMLSITLGGVGLVGAAAMVFDFAAKQPTQVIELLSRWGAAWLLALAAMLLGWDLLKRGLAHLGTLAHGVQESAVAIGRIAEKDDRERDRMITETAYVGQRVERLATEMREHRDEQKLQNDRIEALLRSLQK
jgi:hypothetical protein